jgi:hypothetical protein
MPFDAHLTQNIHASAEIKKYDLLDKGEDEELNELLEIAAAICEAPFALITLSDGDQQYSIAKKGMDMRSVLLKDFFCVETLQSEKPIFTVHDALSDERFKDNVYVTGEPNIRFYIGAPLVTPRGTKIGTLCLMDKKSRKHSGDKEHAVALIAKKVIRYLERRKLLLKQSKQIQFDQKRLRFLTDNVPGAIFQLDYHHEENQYNFSFTSAGISNLHPALKPKQLMEDPFFMVNLVHPDDRKSFKNSIGAAIRDFQPWVKEFRLVGNTESKWMRGIAVPRRYKNVTEWYGVFENINYLKEYQITLEGIAFDISHGLRKPVSNLLGLIDVFEEDRMSQEDNDKFKSYVKTVSVELEKFTKQLNETYSKKKNEFQKVLSQSKPIQE